MCDIYRGGQECPPYFAPSTFLRRRTKTSWPSRHLGPPMKRGLLGCRSVSVFTSTCWPCQNCTCKLRPPPRAAPLESSLRNTSFEGTTQDSYSRKTTWVCWPSTSKFV